MKSARRKTPSFNENNNQEIEYICKRKIFEANLQLDTNNRKRGMSELNNNRYHSFNLRFNDQV